MIFEDRKSALQQKQKENKQILPFATQYQPSVPNLEQLLMKNWHLTQQKPFLSEIYKDTPPPPPPYRTKEGVRSKTYSYEPNFKKVKTRAGESCELVTPILHFLLQTFVNSILVLHFCKAVQIESKCGIYEHCLGAQIFIVDNIYQNTNMCKSQQMWHLT